MTAVACAATLAALPRSASCEPSPPHHRAFWDAALGPILSSNVYRDSTAERDTGYEARLRLGLRSRHSSRTFSQVDYDFDTTVFPQAHDENRIDHAFAALARHRLHSRFAIELKTGLRLARYPHLSTFDNTSGAGQLSLKSYLDSRTTLEGGAGYEKKGYPDYDLDYGGAGLFTTLTRDFGRRTFGELSATFRRDAYTERLVTDAAVAGTGDASALRRDRDWLAGGRVVRDLTLVLRLEAGYQYGHLASNGDSLAVLPGEERLLGDYYSHRRHDLSARLRKLLRRGSSITAGVRYRDRAYRARLARDEDGAFREPQQLRHDRQVLVSAYWDFPVPRLGGRAAFGHFGLRLRASYERNHSNEALYDYSAGILSLSFTSWH